MNDAPPLPPPDQPSSCWLRGCLTAAMVVSAVLVLILIYMIFLRLEGRV